MQHSSEMQPNPYKLTSQVSLAPDPQLSSMMEKFKQVGDAVSFSVVFNEVQRRKEVRNAAQSKMMGGPKPQVADQLIQEAKMAQMPAQPQGMGMGMPQGMPPGGGMPPQGMPPGGGMPPQGMPPQGMPQGGPPQGLPEQAGIGQLPAPNMQNMAGGGIVSFAYGGSTDVPLGTDYFEEGNELDPRYLDYNPPDVTAPETTTNREEDEEDPYPRLDIRDAVGGYGAEMDKLMGEQQANYDKYKAERDKFGPAYANAEARDKEMSQQYEDEARTQRGMPWLAAGAAMMGSSESGLGGLAEAIKAGVPAYTAGRDKLAGLKDKQRDFMQTVAEARRAEARGDTDKLYALQQSMAAQKANIAGVKAELGLKQDEIGATLAASTAEGRKDPGLDKLASRYIEQADAYEAAASDPKNAARKDKYMALSKQYRTKGNELIDRIKNNQFTLSTQTSTYMQEIQGKLRPAMALLDNPDTQAQGMAQLDALGAGYPGGGVSGEYLLELIRSSRGGSSGSTGGVGGGASEGEVQFGSMNRGQ